jgi:hypothetical protein
MTSKEKIKEMGFVELLEGLVEACDIHIEELNLKKQARLKVIEGGKE